MPLALLKVASENAKPLTLPPLPFPPGPGSQCVTDVSDPSGTTAPK